MGQVTVKRSTIKQVRERLLVKRVKVEKVDPKDRMRMNIEQVEKEHIQRKTEKREKKGTLTLLMVLFTMHCKFVTGLLI